MPNTVHTADASQQCRVESRRQCVLGFNYSEQDIILPLYLSALTVSAPELLGDGVAALDVSLRRATTAITTDI